MAAESDRPISDEAVRLAALTAIFPGMQISVEPGKRVDYGWRGSKERPMSFPDALAGEKVYRVVGKATNKAEEGASEDIAKQTFSRERELRTRVFPRPNEGSGGLLVVLQYSFVGANPAMAYLSLGLLVHLIKNGAHWDVHDRFLLETTHHHSLQRVELLDLRGDGIVDLVIESDLEGPDRPTAAFRCST